MSLFYNNVQKGLNTQFVNDLMLKNKTSILFLFLNFESARRNLFGSSK